MLGFSDAATSGVAVAVALGAAVGQLAGGASGDALSRRWPNAARPFSNQLSLALTVPLIFLILKARHAHGEHECAATHAVGGLCCVRWWFYMARPSANRHPAGPLGSKTCVAHSWCPKIFVAGYMRDSYMLGCAASRLSDELASGLAARMLMWRACSCRACLPPPRMRRASPARRTNGRGRMGWSCSA